MFKIAVVISCGRDMDAQASASPTPSFAELNDLSCEDIGGRVIFATDDWFARRLFTIYHGLRTPNEAFFHRNRKLLGSGRQFGQINFGACGLFSAKLLASILVQ